MRKLMVILTILMAIFVVCGNIYADILNYNDPLGNSYANANTSLDKSVKGVWLVIKNILQIVAVGVFLFAGIKYMLASADQKADIKKSLMGLVIGATITFAAATVIPYIVKVVDDWL